MHNAIYRESNTLEVVKGLVDRDASLNSLMYKDDPASRCIFRVMVETPLHTAVALKREDVVRYLISKGADVSIQNLERQTAVECADKHTREVIQTSLWLYVSVYFFYSQRPSPREFSDAFPETPEGSRLLSHDHVYI